MVSCYRHGVQGLGRHGLLLQTFATPTVAVGCDACCSPYPAWWFVPQRRPSALLPIVLGIPRGEDSRLALQFTGKNLPLPCIDVVGQKGSVDRRFSSRMLSVCRHPHGRAARWHTQSSPQRHAVRHSHWSSPLAAPTRDDDEERGVQLVAARLAARLVAACSPLGMLERFIFHEKKVDADHFEEYCGPLQSNAFIFCKSICSPFGNCLRFARLVCEVCDVLVCFKTRSIL
ncbi:uncharacterized protein LOC125508043 [Triticum urartu]|uniref:uncharacterized protein LOC125508043 n=1 Tax=Triticum urartu TaxID=4572 RepID=UPI0020436547|nr:uncharacterized protein LOC125508043 [Triticum urartu]